MHFLWNSPIYIYLNFPSFLIVALPGKERFIFTRLRMWVRYPLRMWSDSSFKTVFLEVTLAVNLPFREEESEFHHHLCGWRFFALVYGYIISLNMLCFQFNSSDVCSDNISQILFSWLGNINQAQTQGAWSSNYHRCTQMPRGRLLVSLRIFPPD